MLDKLADSDIPFDWMFVMFGITLLATGLCTGAPHSGLVWNGIEADATVERLDPSLEERPLDPEDDQPKEPKRKKSMKRTSAHPNPAGERFAHLTFKLRTGAEHETKLKVPAGAVKSFDALRASGEKITIVYNQSAPNYLMRKKDLRRVSIASGGTISVGLLLFVVAALIRRFQSD